MFCSAGNDPVQREKWMKQERDGTVPGAVLVTR